MMLLKKLRKECVVFMLIGSIGISIVGCQKVESKKQAPTLRLACDAEPQNLHPSKALELISDAIVKMCQEPLMRLNAHGVSECGLAERYTVSNNGLSYTFYLRSNAEWSNGDPITAHDFFHAWTKILDPNNQSESSGNAYLLYCIKNAQKYSEGDLETGELGIEVINNKTLKVTLEKSVPYFLDLISNVCFCPVNYRVENSNPNWADDAGQDFACSGPFKLKEWTHSERLNLIKNDHYWDASRVKLNAISIAIVEDSNKCYEMFQKGEIDVIGSYPFGELPLNLDQIKNARSLKALDKATAHWLVCNTNHPLLENLNIRKGLAIAINREELVNKVAPGKFAATTHILPSSMRRNQKQAFQDGDVTSAVKHFELGLKETGLTKNDFNALTLVSTIRSENKKILKAVMEQWRDVLGIYVGYQFIDRKSHVSKLLTKNFCCIKSGWIADYYDPTSFLDIFKKLSWKCNFSGWENKEYIAKLQEANMDSSRENRQLLLEEAEQILIDHFPVIPILEKDSRFLVNSKLMGLYLPTFGPLDFSNAYFEK